jgi:aspartate aminotransferase-like enzyme
MPLADLNLPTRLLAGGGPSAPDARVLQAMALPTIGQFDPDFTAIMDEVIQLGRSVFLTGNRRCFPVGGPGPAGLEAVLNTLLEPGDRVAILDVPSALGSAQALGAEVVAGLEDGPRLVVAPASGDVPGLAAAAHARGALLVLDATLVLGGGEVRVDDWAIDVCLAGVDHCLGGPSGLALVTYSAAVEARLQARRLPPPLSFLDLLQLQAYWSPERLNHHTAPTNLVYGLREALRLVQAEGLDARWARHQHVFTVLLAGLGALGLHVRATPPIIVVDLPETCQDEAAARQQLRDELGIHVQPVDERTWRLGLLGVDATPTNATRLLAAVEHVLTVREAGA